MLFVLSFFINIFCWNISSNTLHWYTLAALVIFRSVIRGFDYPWPVNCVHNLFSMEILLSTNFSLFSWKLGIKRPKQMSFIIISFGISGIFLIHNLCFNVVFSKIGTLLLWLKSTLLMKNKCNRTAIYMKTQCLQNEWDPALFGKEKCFRSRWRSRKSSSK